MAETFEKLRDVLVDLLGVEPSEVTMESDLIADLHMDSLDRVEAIILVEDELSILIDDDEADKVVTVSDAVDLVNKALKAA